MQLHKRDVVAKATEILDNYGIADLTMRRLARELDVSPGALYWHFANKQELLGAVADEVLRPAVAATGPDGWRERITDLAARLRDALLSHADGAELVSASFAAGQSAAMRRLVASCAAQPPTRDWSPGRQSWRRERSSTTCSDSPPTSSPACSGMPPA